LVKGCKEDYYIPWKIASWMAIPATSRSSFLEYSWLFWHH